MPEFPSNKGLVRRVEHYEVEFGAGQRVFRLQAYGLQNLKFMLGECKASIESALEKIEAKIEAEERKGAER